MPSNFPTSLDNLATNKADATATAGDHAPHHDALAFATNAIESSLLNGMPLIDKGGAVYNIKAYGALCDGVTDDAAAINSAISAVPDGATIYFPAGSIAVGSSINHTSTKRLRFLGAGMQKTNIYLLTLGTGPVFNLNSSVSFNEISEMFISCQNATTQDAIYLGQQQQATVKNVQVYRANRGVSIASSSSCTLDRLVISNCISQGIYIDSTSGSEHSLHHLSVGRDETGTTGAGIEIFTSSATGTGGIYMDDCHVIQGGVGTITRGIYIHCSAVTQNQCFSYMTQCVVDGLTTGTAYDINNMQFVQMVNCWGAAANYIYTLTSVLDACLSGSIGVNYSNTGGAVSLQTSCRRIVISGNHFGPGSGATTGTLYNVDTVNVPSECVLGPNNNSGLGTLSNSLAVVVQSAAGSSDPDYMAAMNGLAILTGTAALQQSLNIRGTDSSNKPIRNNAGRLELLNSAYSAVLASLTDSGLFGIGAAVTPAAYPLDVSGNADNTAVGPIRAIAPAGGNNIGPAVSLSAANVSGHTYSFLSTGSGAAAGAAKFAVYNGNTGIYHMVLDSSGQLVLEATNLYTALGQLTGYINAAAVMGSVFKAAAAQTANLYEAQNNGGESIWNVDANGRTPNPRTTLWLYDDFLAGNLVSGSVGDKGWTINDSGAANTAAHVAPVAGRPGWIQLGTAATANNARSLTLHAAATQADLLASELFDILFLVQLPAANTDTNYVLRFGLTDTPATAGNVQPTNGLYVEKLAADAGLFGCSRAASASTRTATALVVTGVATTWSANDFLRIRMRRISSTSVGFSINDNTEQTVTTSLATACYLHAYVGTITTAAKTLNIDYVDLLVRAMSAR